MVELQRLLQHKACLRHRPFGRIHQQQYAVDHFEDALHLAGKIGVPRRIHDVDLGMAVMHRGILCQNRDAALPFQIVAVHHALLNDLVVAVNAALF